MRLTRCTPLQSSSAAVSCTSPCHGHYRLSVHRRSLLPSFSTSSVGDGAGRATEPPHPERLARPQGKRTTAADHVGVQAFLQHALGISDAAATDLVSRGSFSASSFLRLVDCQAWVAYLTRLAGGDTATVTAFLHNQPRLLSSTFDEERLTQLQSHLKETLDLEPPQLLLMVRRDPYLLLALPDTVAAATNFLLTQFFGDSAALRKAVVGHPDLLGCSVTGLQATLQWITGPLGAPTSAALRLLSFSANRSINNTLEPWRQWFLQEGFTPAQVLSLAQAAPALPARKMEGRLAQLKLQYWRQQLRNSHSDLARVPSFMMHSLSRIASRHSALRHLQDATPSHTRFLTALVRGSGTTHLGFGPSFYTAYARQHSVGSDSVQDVLLPLSASLSQPALQMEWQAELRSHPLIAAAGASARQNGALYAALHNIQQRDWAVSDAGLGWLAAEAAAKAADLAARAAKRAKMRLAKLPQRAPCQSSGAASEEDAP